MNFGGFLDIIDGGDDARFTNKSSTFTSPGLSLALQTNMEGQIDQAAPPPPLPRRIAADIFDQSNVCGTKRRSREEEEEEDHDSRSVSDNVLEDVSGDDQDQDGSDNKSKSTAKKKKKKKQKRYHRHTPQQIQDLETLFKECPHPDEKQRLELSRRLNLETRQVKFWFQNRRTQMKTQIERHQNSILRQDNDRLQAENMSIRELAMRSPICGNCGGSAAMNMNGGDLSFEEQHLRIENARLKEELDRVCGLAAKFLAPPPPPPPPSMLGMGSSQFPLHLGPETSTFENIIGVSSNSFDHQRSVYLEIALAAMDELVKMGRTDEPLWVRDLESGGGDVLNRAEYLRMFSPIPISQCRQQQQQLHGFVTEASRVTDLVMINSLALVEILMDSNRWAEMFPCMIAKASTRDIISSGMCGTRNGAIVLMQAEFQVVSPLVGAREVSFLRFCKQHSELGVWAVVDVSVDSTATAVTTTTSAASCRRLPSGFIVQDMSNGYSKVTWVEHAEYDECNIHHLYKPLIRAGMGFGAQPWLATLRRQCQCLAILMSPPSSSSDQTGAMMISPNGKRSMLKLAQRMTHSFCAAVCESATSYKWNKLTSTINNVGEDVRVMTRKSVHDPGEPPGVVLSAATSVWLPISTHRLFDFLRQARFRSEWDILSNGAPMEEMANISKAQDHSNANCVSLLRANAANQCSSSSGGGGSSSSSSMLILQETCTDAAGSLVVYAPVDVPAMHVVMNGGDSAYVALLPSGFAIMPDGGAHCHNEKAPGGGALLTVAFQILVNSLPTAKLTVESVETVNHLISCTIDRIKSALSLL